MIQQISDIANPNANEVVIYLPQRGRGQRSPGHGQDRNFERAARHAGARRTRASRTSTRLRRRRIADALVRKDPLGPGRAAGDRYAQLAKQLADYRDHQARGVVANLDDLRQAGATPAVIAALQRFVLRQLRLR